MPATTHGGLQTVELVRHLAQRPKGLRLPLVEALRPASVRRPRRWSRPARQGFATMKKMVTIGSLDSAQEAGAAFGYWAARLMKSP